MLLIVGIVGMITSVLFLFWLSRTRPDSVTEAAGSGRWR